MLVAQSYPTLCNPMDCSPPASSVHGIFQAREYWSGLSFPSPGDLPNPGIKPGCPASQADSLLSEPPHKPTFEFQGKVIALRLGGSRTRTCEHGLRSQINLSSVFVSTAANNCVTWDKSLDVSEPVSLSLKWDYNA